MQRDRQYLLDILESARRAIGYAAGKSQEDFFDDAQCQDAVIRRLEIIGEAAGRISEGARASLPELPWSSMTGMRNFLIHEYWDVDPTVVWDTLSLDLPPLVEALEKVVSTEDL